MHDIEKLGLLIFIMINSFVGNMCSRIYKLEGILILGGDLKSASHFL